MGHAISFDHLSISILAGYLLQEQNYYPFGLAINEGESNTIIPNQFKYQCKEMHDEVGLNLDDFTARNYDHQIGRFCSTDPASQMASEYTGMANNPANMIDPSGCWSGNASGSYYSDGRSNVPNAASCNFVDGEPTGPTYYDNGVEVGRYAVAGELEFMRHLMAEAQLNNNASDQANGYGYWTDKNYYTFNPASNSNSTSNLNSLDYQHVTSKWNAVDPALYSGGANNWLSNAGTFVGMFAMWMTGYRIPFHNSLTFKNDNVANAMRNARDYFYNKYKGSTDLSSASVTDYSAGFGIPGAWRAGINPIEQFIGNYSIDIFMRGNMLEFNLNNTTSFTSFLYGIGSSWNDGAMGNFNQTYIFTEPIDYKKLK